MTYGLIAVFSIGVTGYLASVVVPQAFVTLTKAAPATVVSLKDSYFLADKIIAAADGVDEARVNVYVMDKSGKGVANKQVSVKGLETIAPESAMTNGEGKTSFRITSNNEGQYKLTAVVEGIEMVNTITVTFRN